MYLVHEKKEKDGKWEVAWMWLPHFLASDKSLHRHVAEKMTSSFKGTTIEENSSKGIILQQMHSEVIRLILEKYPIAGLRQYLEATIHLDPEELEE
jgi:hypothetical protein